MKVFSRKRLLLVGGAVTTVGAAAALLAGATFGFFSSAGTASGNNTFTAGKVVVGINSTTSVTCTIGPMSAGDTEAKSGNVPCEYDVVYTGNVRAFLGLDLSVTGSSGTVTPPYGGASLTGAAGLFDGSTTGLQFTISDAASTYVSGVSYKDVNGASQTLGTAGTGTVTGLLVNTTPVTSATTATHISVRYTLPTTANNAYNVAGTTLTLTIHAVQADNNPLPTSPACAAGNQCLGLNWN